MRYWLVLSAMVSAGALAGQPSAPAPTPAQDTPDDEFIEFLGRDDVGDAEWWEFLKKSDPRSDQAPAPPPPPPPPQDTKQ